MIEIYTPTEATQELEEAFIRLIPQLGNNLNAPDIALLQQIIESKETTLFVAKSNDRIVGTISLVIYTIPTGRKAWIEDVIVDSEARGLGIARKLMEVVIQKAKEEHIVKLDLTSNPTRTAAHSLYFKCGFEKRDTDLFRLEIK